MKNEEKLSNRLLREYLEIGFNMGKEIGKQVDVSKVKSLEDLDEIIDDTYNIYMDNLTQSSEYSNFILPELRKAAGCKDPLGVGTYTECNIDSIETYNENVDKFDEAIYNGLLWEAAKKYMEKSILKLKRLKQ